MTLVIVGATNEPDLEEGVGVFVDSGFQLARWLSPFDDSDGVLPLRGDGAVVLKDADSRGIRYVLVHVGANDGKAGGSHERAHHRVDVAQLRELAQSLKSRERMLIICLAFGFKKGIPDGAAWVVDVRMLENPYWVEELRPLDGRNERVRDFVIGQPAAQELLDNLERTLRATVPHYRDRGRSQLVVAFGCTGGRHRSVAMAREMARRLEDVENADVEFTARELD
ncbi:MAG TPA: RNase adapter RapZ [Candidatus Micrarchaeaceae archaeon]|nr:RNase adapter RapZ [Candidatus Micrarchaeaceae archaeon]